MNSARKIIGCALFCFALRSHAVPFQVPVPEISLLVDTTLHALVERGRFSCLMALIADGGVLSPALGKAYAQTLLELASLEQRFIVLDPRTCGVVNMPHITEPGITTKLLSLIDSEDSGRTRLLSLYLKDKTFHSWLVRLKAELFEAMRERLKTGRVLDLVAVESVFFVLRAIDHELALTTDSTYEPYVASHIGNIYVANQFLRGGQKKPWTKVLEHFRYQPTTHREALWSIQLALEEPHPPQVRERRLGTMQWLVGPGKSPKTLGKLPSNDAP